MKKVFELALSGRNTTQIAYGMNELNLPTPGLYAKRKNLMMGSNPIIAPDSEMLWNAAIVWRILRRYEYTGALVMGRRKKIDVNTTSIRTLPEDKWIIAENAHEAIVTKDEYYQAQKAIRNVTPIQYKVGDDFALKGKICCGNCKRQLRHEKQYGEMVFCCGYKRAAGKFSKCYGGYYREYSVNAKVARAIKTVFYALDVVNQGMQEKQSITVRCMDIEDLEKQAEAIRVEQIKLYESYADGVLLRDAYMEKKKALSEKLAALQDNIRTEKEEQECADELDEEIRALTKQASEKTYIGGTDLLDLTDDRAKGLIGKWTDNSGNEYKLKKDGKLVIKSSSGETKGTYCVAENTDGTLRLNLVISGGTLEYVYTLSDDGSTVELCSPGTDTVHKWTKA